MDIWCVSSKFLRFSKFVVHMALLTFLILISFVYLSVARADEPYYKIKKEDFTPLGWAVIHSDVNTVDQLVRDHADVNELDKIRNSPLCHAVSYKNDEIVTLLINAGADLNRPCQADNIPPPLHLAIEYKMFRNARILLEKGADVRMKDYRGQTPLHIVVSEIVYGDHGQQLEITRSLLNRGADKEARDNYGDTPLHKCASVGNTHTCAALVEAQADVNAINNQGQTPLHMAVRVATYSEHSDLVRLLVEGGADPNIRDKEGKTPLDIAKKTNAFNAQSTLANKVLRTCCPVFVHIKAL